MSVEGHPLDFRELPLFAGLRPSEMTQIGDLLRLQEVDSGTVIVSQAEPSTEACVVLAGTLKVYVEQPDGSDVVLAVLGRGELVGELNMIDHLGRSASVVALETSHLLWLDEASFSDCLRSMPQLTENLLRLLVRRLRLANATILALAALDIQGRIAHQLLALADAYGASDASGDIQVRLQLTEAEFAGMVGASRAKVHQILAVFERNGFLSRDSGGRITLRDRPALRRLCL